MENVLTELHAVTIRDGLAFPNYFYNWTDGQPADPNATSYAKTLLDQLAWWAATLRTARWSQGSLRSRQSPRCGRRPGVG